ncbi:hypothetical protein ES702_01682 [subsurface metagenome]
MQPNTPSVKEDTRERKKRQDHLRYEIRKALLEKQGRKYADLYRCPGCLERKKLRLLRVNKNHNPPGESDYTFLCEPCIKKRQEKKKKTKLWSRGPGIKGGSPESKKIAFLASIRALVFERDGKACVWCGAKEKLGLGPLTPPSRGGKLCYDNYVVTCQECRGAKGSKLPLEYIWGEISLDYWLHEQLDDEPTATPGVTQRVNLHLIAEISQFLMRTATNEDIEGRIRNKAERLNIKLSETDEDRHRERVEVGSWIG